MSHTPGCCRLLNPCSLCRAAEDLLAALKAVSQAVDIQYVTHDEPWPEWIDQVNAAIAKAMGASP